jgi:hypothetical protein
VADSVVASDIATPDTNAAAALAAALTPPPLPIASATGLKPSFIDPDLGTSDATYVVIGSRNVSYLLDKDDIVFNEVLN